ncbi:alpha/beta hydrolase family protein [Gluconobacter wancherniae]|uniref:alpha/beta hydrolase family protein n=1 Tax=Gluconobacter wancherniae TaxID=1307955 RepID=UPI001B8BD2C7|nr:prolyl oligopeptidase family serine peptidase [Gluconobacter wancherniae]MBS1063802.1 prolyl oligopeptidase family serine peptidase [Gluconobacter wancherniae]MBS1095666.1 prolyl oligopeptidase family serine peptidase [Gluconobacter wancherniae]
MGLEFGESLLDEIQVRAVGREKDSEWCSSPIADIAHWHSPVLLIHGGDDFNVEFEQSVLLARMLVKQNIPFENHVFPSERPAFLRAQDWLQAYLWTLHFFDAKLEVPSR